MAELSTRKDPAGDTPAETSADTSSSSTESAETAKSPETPKSPDPEPTEAAAAKSESAETAEPKSTEPKSTEPKSEPAKAETTKAENSLAEPAETEPAKSDSEADAQADEADAGTEGVSAEALSAAAITYASKPAKVKKPRSRPPALVLALSAVLVLLVAGAAVLGWHQHKVSEAKEDRTLALQTAREVATNLTTITSDNFAGQIDALSKVSTSSFKEQMTGYSAMFAALLKQGNVALRGTVTSAGIEKLEGDSAAALVTVSTLITSSQQPQGMPQSFGLLVSLQRDGDHWLASNVDFLR